MVDNARLRARLGMNSKNSSKPPSSDGYVKPAPKSRRQGSGKKPGEQSGAPGKNLPPVADPDEIIDHSPDHCEVCGDDLSGAPVTGEVRRQVFDLPPVVVATIEHRAEPKRCRCGHETTAPFPPEATGPTCYGPNLRALVCYLVVRQHIPIKRVAELLADGYQIPVSTGTIVAMVHEGARRLDAFLASLRDQLARSDVVHADETGLRMDASLYWVHSASNALFTLYHLDKKRGTGAMDAMGVLEHLSGVLVHDGWSPYRSYTAVSHALCNAHHLRELDGVAEVDGQDWATDMVALLADTWHRVLDLKEEGVSSFPADELAAIRSAYDAIIVAGHLANPAPPRRDKEAEVVLGEPVGERRRQQLELITLGKKEVLGHDPFSLPRPIRSWTSRARYQDLCRSSRIHATGSGAIIENGSTAVGRQSA